MDIGLVIVIICVGLIIFLPCTFIGITLEKREFNNGVCKHCGKNLRYFDSDSQGGRGYICDDCGYCAWVSYRCVDKSYRGKKC